MSGFVKSILFVIIISSICSAVLAAIKIATADKVEFNQKIVEQREVLAVFGLEIGEKTAEQISKDFADNVEEINLNNRKFWKLNKGKNKASVAFVIQGMGFWAPVHAILALKPDIKTILGVRFYKHSETPGLGGRISEQWFRGQFNGKTLDPDGSKIRLISSGKTKLKNDVDAITGATETSKKVEQILREDAINAVLKLRKNKI